MSRNFLEVLGVQPALGRGFSPTPTFGPPDEVVISHRLWQRLGGTPQVLGTTLGVDPRQYTIVGVMPADFSFPVDHHFWTSLPKDMEMLRTARDLRFLTGVGRLHAGATLADLRTELAVLTERHPASARFGGAVSLAALGLKESIVGQTRRGVTAAAAAAAVLLLIACANVAALLLARAAVRRREMAIQAALGASGGRLVRQGAIEVGLLALAAGALGALAAGVCRNAIVYLSQDEIPRVAAMAVDARTLGFAFLATLTVALLTTLLPAWLSSRTDASEGLRSSRGETQATGTIPVLRMLVVVEVALTLVLVISGLLLGRTLHGMATRDRGFSDAAVVAMRIHLPLRPRLAKDAEAAFYLDVAERAAALPAVRSVGFASRLPLSEALASTEVHAIGNPANEVKAILNTSGPGYFETVGAALVAGTDLPRAAGQPAVVINELLARRLFGDAPAVGRLINLRYMTGPVEAVVAGVSRPIRYNGLTTEAAPEIYLDYRLRPLIMYLFARVEGEPSQAIQQLKSVILAADPTGRVTLDPITTLDREISRHLARPRFFLVLVGTFGIVALVLAAGGVYGILSFTVAQRRHELGVRLALGASGRDVFRHVAGDGAVLMGAGLVAGLATALATSRLLRSLLFGVEPWDLPTFAAGALLIAVVTALACWHPARRAQQTDPLAVLRQ